MKTRTSNLIASLLLIAIIVASSAYWLMRFRQSSSTADASVATPLTTPQANMSATEALFGERPAALSSIGDLRITGVVIAENPDDSIAIMIESDHPGRAVRVGADVTPGIHLTEVHRRYVVLSDGTSSTRVNLPEGVTQDAAAPQTVTDSAPPPAVSASGGLRGEPPHRTGDADDGTDAK
jgi:general secretion pathway protein C